MGRFNLYIVLIVMILIGLSFRAVYFTKFYKKRYFSNKLIRLKDISKDLFKNESFNTVKFGRHIFEYSNYNKMCEKSTPLGVGWIAQKI